MNQADPETQAVVAANEAFYRAFETLDLAQMAAVWADHERVTCVLPGWKLARGHASVMASWEAMFKNTSHIRFSLSDVHVQLGGALAVVTLIENVDSANDDNEYRVSLPGTNVFERIDGRWRLVHHHASPIALSPPETKATTLH